MAKHTILPSALRASTGSSATITVPQDADLRVELDATADDTGTSLDANVEHSEDGGTSWTIIGALPQIGATTPARSSLAISGPHSGLIRVSWTVVGTSYTFSSTVRTRVQ